MSIVDYFLDIQIFMGTKFCVLKCQNDVDP